MEAYAVAAIVLSSVAATKKRTRQTYDDDTVAKVTASARHFGATTAAAAYNAANNTSIPVETVQTWLKFWKDTQRSFTNTKRGRPTALTTAELDEVRDAFGKIRAPPTSRSVSASEVAAITRGVVTRSRPGALLQNGGSLCLGPKYATAMMHREGLTPRKVLFFCFALLFCLLDCRRLQTVLFL